MEHTGAEQGILICDRGTLDSEAYCGREMFEQIVSEEKMSIASLREFYDVVYHFVTAAEGAQKYYTLANNKARRETPKEARALDQLLRDAWTGHEHLEIIHNRESGRVLTFRQKMDKFITSVTNQLAMPPIEAEKKFQLLDKINVKKLPVSRIIQQEIFQIYLHSDKPNLQRRIRKITPIGQGLAETFYVYAEKEKIPGTAHRPEMQDRISISEYERLLHQKNPNLAPILKIRHNFVYDFKYWHLDIFIEPEPNLCFIEHEHAINSREKITPPSFLGRYVDITSSFSNYDLASGKRPVKK